MNSIYKVKNIEDNLVTLIDIDSAQTYQIVDFPSKKLLPGILLDGTIGKMNDDFFWTWHYTACVYPEKAQQFICFVD
ncbi:hypothetical protein ACFSTA_17485 [Ornithinibacillus salinisoli]|uniref:Uncharacterized protein n=1 Tax=Ornithinibacillus salinisoli TaxID=1848459 RepID=A0ABW4W2B3_9BACI